MHDDTLASGAQQDWEAIADLLRGHVAGLARREFLSADDLAATLNIASTVLVFDIQVRLFDERLANGGTLGGNDQEQET